MEINYQELDLYQIKKIIYIIILTTPSLSLFAQESEYEVKAHFLGRFAFFVDWPQASSVKDSAKPFVIGVFGKEPFNGLLDEIYKNEKIKGKDVYIPHINHLKEIDKCDMLFISTIKDDELEKILEITADKPVLTLADTPGYAEAGVLINLYKEQNKIRFEINYNAVKKTGLTFNYKLLELARIIDKESK